MNTSEIRLIPVLDLEAGQFQTDRHPFPEKTSREVPHEWDAYWRRSLADQGILNLEPYQLGSTLVPLKNLTNIETLAIILRIEFESYLDWHEVEDILDVITSLSGGFVLEVDDSAIAFPQCCGSLEDLKNWKECSEYLGEDVIELWIGHPWLLAKSLGPNVIEISASENQSNLPENLLLNRNDLNAGISTAFAELYFFRDKIVEVLPSLIPKKHKEAILDIAEIMVFGQNNDH